MAKQKLKDIKDELEKEDDEFYGDEARGGHMEGLETDDDTIEAVNEDLGTDLKPGEEFNLGDEIEKAEEDQHHKPDPNYDEE